MDKFKDSTYLCQISDYTDGRVCSQVGDIFEMFRLYGMNRDADIGEFALYDITEFGNPVRMNALELFADKLIL